MFWQPQALFVWCSADSGCSHCLSCTAPQRSTATQAPVVGQNPTLRIRCPIAHRTLLQHPKCTEMLSANRVALHLDNWPNRQMLHNFVWQMLMLQQEWLVTEWSGSMLPHVALCIKSFAFQTLLLVAIHNTWVSNLNEVAFVNRLSATQQPLHSS